MNKNIGVCRDCFAFKPSRCSVLTEMICKTRKCSFYKTRKQFIEGLKKYPPREDSGFNITKSKMHPPLQAASATLLFSVTDCTATETLNDGALPLIEKD